MVYIRKTTTTLTHAAKHRKNIITLNDSASALPIAVQLREKNHTQQEACFILFIINDTALNQTLSEQKKSYTEK